MLLHGAEQPVVQTKNDVTNPQNQIEIDAVKLLAITTTTVKLLAVKQLAQRGDTNAVTHGRMTWAAHQNKIDYRSKS